MQCSTPARVRQRSLPPPACPIPRKERVTQSDAARARGRPTRPGENSSWGDRMGCSRCRVSPPVLRPALRSPGVFRVEPAEGRAKGHCQWSFMLRRAPHERSSQFSSHSCPFTTVRAIPDPDLRLAVAHLMTAPERCCEDLESERWTTTRRFESASATSDQRKRCADPFTSRSVFCSSSHFLDDSKRVHRRPGRREDGLRGPIPRSRLVQARMA